MFGVTCRSRSPGRTDRHRTVRRLGCPTTRVCPCRRRESSGPESSSSGPQGQHLWVSSFFQGLERSRRKRPSTQETFRSRFGSEFYGERPLTCLFPVPDTNGSEGNTESWFLPVFRYPLYLILSRVLPPSTPFLLKQ